MRRREFISLLGGAAATWPFAARAEQSGKIPTVGVLVALSAPHPFAEAFRSGMLDLGYNEGRNIAFEWRYADAQFSRAMEHAHEFVRLQVDVIAAYHTPAVKAAMNATKTIPIVMSPAQKAGPCGTGWRREGLACAFRQNGRRWRDGMPRLELILRHSASADGYNARRILREILITPALQWRLAALHKIQPAVDADIELGFQQLSRPARPMCCHLFAGRPRLLYVLQEERPGALLCLVSSSFLIGYRFPMLRAKEPRGAWPLHCERHFEPIKVSGSVGAAR
jgi:hypothetical protein